MKKNSVIDDILREREYKNERTLAIVRLLSTIASIFEFLQYYGFIRYLPTEITIESLILDSVFFIYSLIVLLLVLKKAFHKNLKFFIISFDYAIIATMLTFDPSVPKGKEVTLWVTMIASLFLYYLNLLRYSKPGTIYGAFMSIFLFLGMNIFLAKQEISDIIGTFIPFLVMIYIGYSITESSINMMHEANTKKMMERYLPQELVGELYNRNLSLEPGGVLQKVTILFIDIRSFTSISESLPVDRVVMILNDYLSTMTEIIFSNRGTIDKFIGDSIMTIFGAPIKGEDDSKRAVITAVQMLNQMKSFNEKYPELPKALEIGIGIHTGEVIAGNIGSSKRLDYTVIGDTVNLASRIEGLTKHYRTPILVTETTYNEIKNDIDGSHFFLREIDTVQVKGKEKSIKVFQVMPTN
ncbi:MAG: adenylate/guanylate cyclase domain-containing protein [Leptospiraceae bacterium]|nr:adenylate/guanylate cyclase domain-containing protein [Leptospiraceae bacterium]